jgi:Type I phosphodiesterase / nucleotide pyrophosphatase
MLLGLMTRFRTPPLAAVLMLVALGFLIAPSASRPEPALVVVLTVDQLRPDYLPRWQDQWRGGFRELLLDGAVFLNGRQDHALTETAPGHSTILSGRDPAHTDIVLNELGVGDSAFPLLDAPDGEGASPHRFKGSTLVNWMRKTDPALRFLSLAGKDRSAILTIGRSQGPVFWYRRGRFTTSRYYADALPAWLVGWNSRRGAERLAGTSWTLLRPDSTYSEQDRVPFEAGGSDVVFPHLLPADSATVVRSLPYYPWMDSLTLDLALEGVRNLGLGEREKPDLLALGLSATDYVGHRWGPDSREMHDHLLRLDHWLGWFFDSLSTLVPRERTIVVLTADHGVTSFPEFAQLQGRPGGRIPLEALVRDVNFSVGRLTGDSAVLHAAPGLIYGDTARLRELRVSPESLATALAPRVWGMPGVVTAWTPGTLGSVSPDEVHAVRWLRSLPRSFPWLVCAVAQPGYVWADDGGHAEHGTSNDDDVDVPIIFMGSMIRPGNYSDTVRTTDIGPTLARLLDVKPGGLLDGLPIKRVFK